MPDREKVKEDGMDWKKKAETLGEIAGYFEICSQNADPTGKAKTKFLQYVEELNALSETLKEQENQLTMKYEEGFHDGYKQAMRDSDPCYECQEFYCDDCKFKGNRTVKRDAFD